MADSRKETKIVEYQLQGNTVNLDKSLEQAISTIDALDQKLTKIAASARTIGGTDKTSFKRAAAISSAESQLQKTRKMLDVGQEGAAAVSPDQLNLLNQMNNELGSILGKLNSAKDSTRITQKTLDKTGAGIRNVNAKLRAANIQLKEAEDHTHNIHDVLRKILSVIALVRILAHYFEKLYTAAGDFVETINLFNVAVKGSKDELTAFAERMADAYNTDSRPIYNSIAVFRQYANTLRFASESADIFADGLTKLNYDLASLYNVEYDTMATALKSGMSGQTKSLMKYGISVHTATVEQTALRLGIKKSSSEWSAAERVALRYLTVLEQTTNAQGDLARTLESPTNQFKILKAQLQVLLRNLGSLVVLISQKVLPVVNGLLIAFNAFLEAIAKAAGYEIEDYSDNLSPTNEMLGEMEDEAGDAEDALKHLLAPLDEINQANQTTGDGLGIGDGLDPEIEAALRTYDNLMDQISTKTDALAEMFGKIFNPQIAEGIGRAFGGAFDLIAAAVDLVVSALTTLAPILKVVFTIIGAILTAAGWLLDNIVTPIISFIQALIDNIGYLIAAFVALNVAQYAFTGEMKSMMAVKIIKWFGDLAAKIWANVSAHLANIAAVIKEKMASVALAAVIWWETAAWWQKAIAIIAAAGAMALVVAGIVAAATASTRATARATTSENLAAGKAAKGGVATGPTLTWIGEGKYNEAVVPLGQSPQFKSMKEDIADRVYGKVAQAPYSPSGQPWGAPRGSTVILNVNGRELARALLPDLGITRPQTGVNLV